MKFEIVNELPPGRIGGRVTVPLEPVEVVLTVVWSDGTSREYPARVRAWTPQAVWVRWYPGDHSDATQHSAWFPPTAVRRRPEPRT